MTTSRAFLGAPALALRGSACTSVLATPQQEAVAEQSKVLRDRATVCASRNESMGAAVKFDLPLDGTLLGRNAG